MPVQAIVGAQWGDEGKGKITDLLAQDADLVMRFGGGNNAGHTVVNEYGTFKLHSIPSGIFNPNAISLIGTGTVVDFGGLRDEVGHLAEAGMPIDGLRISSRAHVVMPYHPLLDRLREKSLGSSAIGTTGRGIGPTYVDKANRVGIQAGDILRPDVLRRKLELLLPDKNQILTQVYGEPPLLADDLMHEAAGWRAAFGPLIVDQLPLVSDALAQDRSILLEGQLGALRDLDWGTYPFVTSSTTIAGGGAVGGGIPPMLIDRVVGVVKAYTTAVGAGPLPVELDDDVGDRLRTRGDEFGATTGRPRRVGWFDAVAARFSCTLNRFTGVAITKLDVLDGLPSLKICTSYRVEGKSVSTVPSAWELEEATPEYEELEGWNDPTEGAREWSDLPSTARKYVERIEALVGAPVTLVSVGPGRDQTIVRSPAR